MTTTTTTWLVLVSFDGDPEACTEVYQSADSYSEAIRACEDLTRVCPEWYCEVATWAEAEAQGLVS
jgi:hypothetical protein